MADKPSAIIIGAGFTGCALAHDLALRGFAVTVFERGEISSGTSGRTHGLLHSGGRYCVNDPEAGVECIQENIILRKIARQCIEFNGGLFVAITEEDQAYAAVFTAGAQACGIPVEELTPAQALEMEPHLNHALLSAYTVPDGAFDPLRLALAFAATAKRNGASFFAYHQVKSLIMDGQGKVSGVRVWQRTGNREFEARADIVINATGAWAGEIADMAHAAVPVIPTPGIMVAYDQRLTQRVINRLAPPGDGDILVPQRRMVLIGTTSYVVENPDYLPNEPDQIQAMFKAACELVPAVASTHQRGVWTSARPLIGSSVEARSLSRTFKCYDHAENGIPGLVTITGGKATTCRAMAESTADVVCARLGISAPCVTREVELIPYREYYR